MGSFRLLNYAGDSGEAHAGILVGGNSVIDLQRALQVVQHVWRSEKGGQIAWHKAGQWRWRSTTWRQ